MSMIIFDVWGTECRFHCISLTFPDKNFRFHVNVPYKAFIKCSLSSSQTEKYAFPKPPESLFPPNVTLMFGQRRRRWATIKAAYG